MWEFDISTKHYSRSDAYNDSDMNHFKGSPHHESFIRELIQNSLDARKDLHAPVCLTFKIKKIEQEALNSVHFPQIKEILGQKQTWEKQVESEKQVERGKRVDPYKRVIKSLNNLPFPILFVSESNTTGMPGPWNKEGTKFHSFAFASGDNNKSRSGGGTHGIGKAALRLLSPARLIFFSTAYGLEQPNGQSANNMSTEHLALGIIRTSSDNINESKRSAWGYWFPGDNSSPVIDFKHIPDWLRREKEAIGTNFAIAGYNPDDDNDKEYYELLGKVLPTYDVLFAYFVYKNFFKAICDGDLEVRLCNPPAHINNQKNKYENNFYMEGIWTINKDNIEGQLRALYPEIKKQEPIFGSEQESILESIEETLLAIWCLTESPPDGYEHKKDNSTISIDGQKINCSIRTIVHSKGNESRLFDIKSKKIIFVRRGFVITSEFPGLKNFPKSAPPFLGLFFVDPDEIIAACEPPAHNDVNINNIHIEQRKMAEKLLKSIREQVRAFINQQFAPRSENNGKAPWIFLRAQADDDQAEDDEKSFSERDTSVLILRPSHPRPKSPLPLIKDRNGGNPGPGPGPVPPPDPVPPGPGGPIIKPISPGVSPAIAAKVKILSVTPTSVENCFVVTIVNNTTRCRLESIEFREKGQFDTGAEVYITPIPNDVFLESEAIREVNVRFINTPPKVLDAKLVLSE